MIKAFLSFLSAIVLLNSATAWSVQTPPTSVFQKGDQAFRERANADRAKEALEIYRSLYQSDPENPESAWRLSMACYFVGLRHEPKGKRAKLFAEGRDAGKKSLKQAKECAPCHFWTAINMALYGREVGVLKTLVTLSEIRDHLRKSLEIDPTYARAGAQRLLGAIDENLPGIFGGSERRALESYEKAIAIAPDEPLNYLFLAKLLMKKRETREKGLKIAEQGALISLSDASFVESVDAQVELRKLLASNGVQSK